MKRFSLTLFFAFYHIFAPFVLLNCSSSDMPYVTEANADEAVDPAAKLEECENQQFLTDDCVGLIQAEGEADGNAAEAVIAAYDALPDFIQCEKTSASEDGEVDADAPNCEEIVADVLDGYDACLTGDVAGKEYSCGEIQNNVTSATDLCDSGDASVTADFCVILG